LPGANNNFSIPNSSNPKQAYSPLLTNTEPNQMIVLSEAKKLEDFSRPNLIERTAASSSLLSRLSPEKGGGGQPKMDLRKKSFQTNTSIIDSSIK